MCVNNLRNSATHPKNEFNLIHVTGPDRVCSSGNVPMLKMEDIHNIVQKLNVPTIELRLEVIQEVLIKVKQCRRIKEIESEKEPYLNIWYEVCEVLWLHLQTGFKNLEEELLGATCFYSIIPYIEKQDYFLHKILEILKSEICLRTNSSLVVSLMYGMFQSSFFSHDNYNTLLVTSVLEYTFDLLLLMGYEYTKFSFLAFKTINSFKRVCGTKVEYAIFNKENQFKLLNLVNHNWENPVTGVRDLIRSIFQTVIQVVDETILKSVMHETNKFYWNKAKYLMLTEILECRVNDVISLSKENDLVEGLVYSLHKPGLVSAGSDMYYATLKLLKSEENWSFLFISHIIKILESESHKAIENFTNYWCLTTFKRFPYLMNKLLEEIQRPDKSKQTFYGTLCLMKQGNKLGLLIKKWIENDTTTKSILLALEHNNKHVRMMAFDIICIRNEKSLPSQMEYNLILDFLQNNVNSDSTVLRLAMLGSFKHFLTHLHVSFINYINKSNKEDENNLVQFCTNLQEFIIASLCLNGNYQRKITSIKISNIMLNCFHVVPRKRKDQTKPTSVTLIGFLRERKKWVLDETFVLLALELLKDPTNDIRENIIQLLVNYYWDQFKHSKLQDLKEKAFISMRSKFFYEIDCGKDMLKLLINILLKQKTSELCPQDVEDLFNAGYNQLMIENNLKRNIMISIENGTQLHSFISVLYVVIEACILNFCKLKISEGTIIDLLNTLEDITNQFSWEQQSSTSSDFSKMNEMVENIIVQSGYDLSKESYKSKISGQHQIVLNCLWLNVKACCDFASLLIRYYSENISICDKSLKILTHVLETSRHKGAIESAGAALGLAIRHLSSQSVGSNASDLPYILLKSKLNELVQQASNMASITRRGAGLSIMVHRIVSSDMKEGKPLFVYFIDKLLEACDQVEDVPPSEDEKYIENQADLPKAIYIHFLTKIVTDSSLASDVTYYSAKLSQLAYNNLTSPHWQIRNAALQLYGALVPRQIGQKKASGIDDETIATVAYDELRTHSPKLWSFIINQLKNKNNCDEVQSHSNLVSVLNLLANTAKRYNFSYNIMEQSNADEELLNYFVLLLGSPIFTVRRLTAKCLFNIYPFETIYKILINLQSVSENSLHGHLILLRHCHKYYLGSVYKTHFKELQEKFAEVITNKKNHSYICRELYADMFVDNITFYDINKTLEDAQRNLNKAGVDIWVNTILQKYISGCSWDEVSTTLALLRNTTYFEKFCELLIMKLESSKIISECTFAEITKTLLLHQEEHSRILNWKILYEISLKTQMGYIDLASHFKDINEDLPYNIRYLLPFAARVVSNRDIALQLKLSKIIYNLTNPEKFDVDMRYIAALANNEFTSVFDNMLDTSKILLIKSAVNLLQDEDEDVRNLCVFFYKTINRSEMPLNPYICLQRILELNFLKNIFRDPQTGIKIIYNDLSLTPQSSQSTKDEYNPFTNDSKNIYFEFDVLKQLIEKLKFVTT